MKLSIINGAFARYDEDDNINGTPSQVGPINGIPSQVGPLNGIPSQVGPMNGFYPNSYAIDQAINGSGMDDDDRVAFETAIAFGDELAINGLDDPEAVNGFLKKRKERKAKKKAAGTTKRAERKAKRKDKKANSVGANRRKDRRTERAARRDRRAKGEGFGSKLLEAGKEIVSNLTGKGQQALEDMYDEGIDPDMELMEEMDAQGGFKDYTSPGESKGDNTMLFVGLAALAFLALKK